MPSITSFLLFKILCVLDDVICVCVHYFTGGHKFCEVENVETTGIRRGSVSLIPLQLPFLLEVQKFRVCKSLNMQNYADRLKTQSGAMIGRLFVVQIVKYYQLSVVQ